MNILPLLTFLFISSHAEFTGSDINYEIAHSLVNVIEEFFVPRSSSFALILSCESQRTTYFFKDLVEVVLDSWGNIKTQIIVNTATSGQIHSDDRINNLLLVDSWESFLKIDPASKVGKHETNEYYHIFLQNQDQFIPDDIQRILDYCWRNYIVNVNIQVQKSSGETILYTYFPFTKSHCGEVIPDEINRYRNGTWENDVLFPQKLRDMHNCPLKVGTWQSAPYIKLDLTKQGRAAVSGCEGKLLNHLSQLMNFDIEIIVPPNNEQRGVITGNRSTGAIGMLLKRELDLSLGCFWYAAERTQILTASVSFLHSTNVAVLLASSANFAPVPTLWFPFDQGASACLLVAFLISFGLLRLLTRLLEKLSNMYPTVRDRNFTLNFIACSLGLPSALNAQWNAGRIFIMAWMIFGLVIRINFGAVIYHLIRNNLFRKAPSTISEVMKLNYSLALNTIAYNALKPTSVFTDIGLNVVKVDDKYPAFIYMEDHSNEKILTIAPFISLMYYIAKHRKSEVWTILKESFLQQSSCIYFPKHSFLAERISFLIQQINAVGLMDGWLKQSIDLTYLLAKKTKPVFTIGQRELKGIYYLCGTMMVLSFVVFCLEIMSLKFEFLRKVFRKI